MAKIHMAGKYKTRNGLPATIAAIEQPLGLGFSVIAIIEGKIYSYSKNGEYMGNFTEKHRLDLVEVLDPIKVGLVQFNDGDTRVHICQDDFHWPAHWPEALRYKEFTLSWDD